MGDAAIRLQLAQMFVNNNSDMILAIGTGASQSVVAETETIPIVITAVTDPVAAGLAASIQRPGGNVMGMSDLTPVASQIVLLQRLIPDVQTIGVIFNSGEINSRIQADMAREKVESIGLIYVEATVTGTADIASVAESLAGRVDVIYIPTCNTLASAYSLVIQIADEHGVPVIVGESAGVDQGAVATEGINYYNLGRRTGEMALMLLRGEAVLGEMPIEFLDRNDVVLNMEAVARHGIVVPEDILARAERR
jgi:putative ABC transport system substrate-binding protein